MVNQFSTALLNSMQAIANKAISAAKFDKTIIGTVVKCTDAATGRYKVKYQDASYVATADSLDKQYKEGASVYLLVPEGDFSKPKKIIGEISSSTETSSSSQSDNPISNLIEVGDNIIIAPENFSTNKLSYGREANEYLTIFNLNSNDNKVTVNNENLNKNILEGKCRYFRFSANFKTELSSPQQFKGEYGLLLTLKYKDENEVEQIQDYKLDSSGMYGNPYKFTNWVNQSSIFNLPLGTDIEIIKIGLYSYNFSDNYTADKSNLIYVSNLKLIPMGESSSTYFSTYAMEINGGDQGLIFNSSSLKLKPIVTYQNRPVDISNAEIYWFKEDSQVTSSHSSYAQQGGKGWACLNNISILEINGSQISRFNSQLELELQKPTSYAAAEVRYKCVVILSNATIEKEFLITNPDYNQKLILTSSNGNSFTNQTSATTLTASFSYRSENSQKLDKSKLQYNWHTISQTGEIENIYYHGNENNVTNTIERNESLKLDILNGSSNKSIYERIKKLEQVIDEGSSKNPPTFSKDTLFGQHYLGENKSDDYTKEISNFKSQNSGVDKFILSQMGITLTELATLNYNRFKELLKKVDDLNFITFLHEDIFYELPARLNTGTTTYVCSCNLIDGDNSIYLGSARVQIANDYKTQETATGWSVNIVNGAQFFKYDATGDAPTKKTQRNPQPQLIKSLSFNVFDEKGKQIDDAKIVEENPKKDTIISSWYWEVPAEDTLLSFDKELIGEQAAENRMYKIYNVKLLPFGIADSFNNDTGNNIIYLTVNYKDGSVKTQTNFSFIKDGNNGTNATDFYCKVSPNLKDNVQLEEYPAIIYTGSQDGILNFTPNSSGEWFKAELFLNGESYPSNSISWKVLTNNEKMSNGTSELTKPHFNFDSKNKKWSVITKAAAEAIENPSNIMQASISYSRPRPSSTNTGSTTVSSGPTEIYGSITLDTIFRVNDNYKIRVNPRSGFTEVVYGDNGSNPEYPKNKNFEVEIFWKDDSQLSDNLAKQTAETAFGTPFIYEFLAYGPQGFLEVEQLTEEGSKHMCKVTAKNGYGGYETNCGLYVKITDKNGNLIGEIYHPIHLMINRYGKAAINGWDGNSISINDKDGVILSPQVGAGKKDSNNRFTGIVIGTVKENDHREKDGLFGYENGNRTIFLDANTGNAYFGKAGVGQIAIEPKETGDSTITGGSYKDEKDTGTGMKIGIGTDPYIKWGNQKFSVDSQGILSATEAKISGTLTAGSGSKIGPWYISNDSISKNSGGTATSSHGASGAGNMYFGNSGLSISNVFKVSNTGHLEASSVNIGNGKLTFDANGLTVSGTITGSTINGSTINGTEIYGANNKFSVKNDGTVNITGILKAGADSEIGPWKVGATSISLTSNGDEGSGTSISIGKNGIVYQAEGINVFKVGSTGHVTLIDSEKPKEGDNANPDDGNSLLIIKNNASGADKITYLKPNRITFIDKTAGAEADYTGGSLLYYGGEATSAENAEEGDVNDVNYFYFTRPFALPLSRSIKGDTSQTGWKNTWYSIKGMGGVPVLSQAYWNEYETMTDNKYKYSGYALVFGPSSKHTKNNPLPTSTGSAYYKQTVIRGGNVHMVAHAGKVGADKGNSNGDIILKGEGKIVIATKAEGEDFSNIVFRDRVNGREITLQDIIDALLNTNGADIIKDALGMK